MKALSAFFVTLALSSAQAGHSQEDPLNVNKSLAQANMSKESVVMTEKEYKKQVENSVFESCNRSAPITNIKERSKKCECYANAYISRYSSDTLAGIANWSANNASRSSIIVTMMTPEAVKCGILKP